MMPRPLYHTDPTHACHTRATTRGCCRSGRMAAPPRTLFSVCSGVADTPVASPAWSNKLVPLLQPTAGAVCYRERGPPPSLAARVGALGGRRAASRGGSSPRSCSTGPPPAPARRAEVWRATCCRRDGRTAPPVPICPGGHAPGPPRGDGSRRRHRHGHGRCCPNGWWRGRAIFHRERTHVVKQCRTGGGRRGREAGRGGRRGGGAFLTLQAPFSPTGTKCARDTGWRGGLRWGGGTSARVPRCVGELHRPRPVVVVSSSASPLQNV